MGIVSEVKINQACIDACTKCAQACFECYSACLNEEDVHSRTEHIKMLMECALMCQHSVMLMATNSPTAVDHCKQCGEMCQECADGCNGFDEDHCKKCAKICETCANECNNM